MLFQHIRKNVRKFRQTTAEQRFHDDCGDVQVGQAFVEIIGVDVVLVDIVCMLPVDVVHLNLHEVPVIFVMIVEEPFDDALVAVERESEVTDAAGFALFLHKVDGSVVDVAFLEGVPATQALAAVAHGM